jgi:succinoglycan biosynthesis protein ExoM
VTLPQQVPHTATAVDARAHPARVAICIATCGRTKGLRELLAGIDRQEFSKEPVPDVRVIVVENGTPAGAREVCAATRPSWGWQLQYAAEPRLGIPQARNRALRMASIWPDFVAFIDDDEVPEPCWLDELLHVQRMYGADVVDGALRRRFEEPVPDWIVRGRFFEPTERRTGTPRRSATTGNTLVRRSVFAAVGEFDERFALTGGSDTQFFQRVSQRGHSIIWASEAIVYEHVPRGRATVNWYLRRAFRIGNTWSLCQRDLHPGTRFRHARHELRKLVRALVDLPGAALSGQATLIRCLRRLCEAAGNISGAVGVRFQEYSPNGWMTSQRKESGGSPAPDAVPTAGKR